MGTIWALLGTIGNPMGAIWALLEATGTLLGAIGNPMGAIWALLGAMGNPMGAISKAFKRRIIIWMSPPSICFRFKLVRSLANVVMKMGSSLVYFKCPPYWF